MTIEFTCPKCPARYKVPDELAGRHASCKSCSAQFVIPSPFFAFARTPDGKGKEVVSADGARVSQTGRPFSMIAALGGIALIASVFLPWVQTSLSPIAILGYPEGGIAPFQLVGNSQTALDPLGIDTLASTLPAIAKFAFLLIPLAGLIVLLREMMTFSSGKVPRLALLLGAVLPIVAIGLSAVGFAQSQVVLQEGESVASSLHRMTMETAASDSPMAIATAGLKVSRDYLSVGTAVCGLGVLLVLLAALFTRPGEKAASTATAGAGTGKETAEGQADADGTMMFRAEEKKKAGATSILQASAAAATNAALATLTRNGDSTTPAARAERAAAAAVGTAAAIESTLAAVEQSSSVSESGRVAAATATGPGGPEAPDATEVMATEVVPGDTVEAVRDVAPASESPAPPVSDDAAELPPPVAADAGANGHGDTTGATMPSDDVAELPPPVTPESDPAPSPPSGPTTTDPFADPFGDSSPSTDASADAPDPFATDEPTPPPPPATPDPFATDADAGPQPGDEDHDADESFDDLA